MQKTLGILGGGQLGRMSALAAAKLGINTHIFTPESGSPASQVATHTTVANYDDEEALKNFAQNVDVITYEFENIPVKTIETLKKYTTVYPDEKLLQISQDRIAEKTFLNEAGIKTTRWATAHTPQDIDKTIKEWKAKGIILKTTRFGYDGKGQVRHGIQDNSETSWKALNTSILIVEEIVPFEHEISIIIARDSKGNTETYGPMLNMHKNHILHKTIAPAPISFETAKTAKNLIQKIAEAIDLIGVMTIELFLTKNGELLANEIAPRTHNSGHWSIEACEASQFENHVRSVCDLPLGSAKQLHDAEMLNLIGHDIDNLQEYKNNPYTYIHLYGKEETRPGRKMGHITTLKQNQD